MRAKLDLLKLHSIFSLIIDSLISIFRLVCHAYSRSCMKKNLFPSEQRINILQGQVSGLRVEEVDERKEEEVEYAKIDISLVADVVDADRRNFDDQEGKDPVRGCG